MCSRFPARRKRHIACDEFFMLRIKNSERTHSAAPPFQPRFAAQPLAALPPYGCGVPLAGASLDSWLVWI